jgi:mRNA-degrading endonuclease RelE of RelBE toxin-antitoxin system
VNRPFHWSPRALRDLEGLEPDVQGSILNAVDLVQAAPRFPGPPTIKKLSGREAIFRLRVGDFRLIYAAKSSHHLVLRVIDRKELESVLRRL